MEVKKIENGDLSYEDKVSLRLTAVRQLASAGSATGAEPAEAPVVLEAYGGFGDVWSACYRDVVDGIVFETDSMRAIHLAHQRPTWAVYEADCVSALAHGAGAHLEVNLLDVDPYGDAWPAIRAFFGSTRPFAEHMVVVVNDGLRWNTQTNVGWQTATLEPVVNVMGNDLWDKYLDVCALLMREAANMAGYEVVFFDGYYTGPQKKRTHFLAELRKRP